MRIVVTAKKGLTGMFIAKKFNNDNFDEFSDDF